MVSRAIKVTIDCTPDKEKLTRRILRLKLIACFFNIYLKIALSPYPVLPDTHILLFCIFVLNYRFVVKHFYFLLVQLFVLGAVGLMTFFMWLLWLNRFSGNANFLFF